MFILYPTETGWAEAQKFYDEALAGVRAQTGGADGLDRWHAGKLKGAAEHRPGTYIYNDRMQVGAGARPGMIAPVVGVGAPTTCET